MPTPLQIGPVVVGGGGPFFFSVSEIFKKKSHIFFSDLVSGHLEARRAQAVSAPLRDFDQQLAFLVGRDG